jgi:hypothetical protein
MTLNRFVTGLAVVGVLVVAGCQSGGPAAVETIVTSTVAPAPPPPEDEETEVRLQFSINPNERQGGLPLILEIRLRNDSEHVVWGADFFVLEYWTGVEWEQTSLVPLHGTQRKPKPVCSVDKFDDCETPPLDEDVEPGTSGTLRLGVLPPIPDGTYRMREYSNTSGNVTSNYVTI